MTLQIAGGVYREKVIDPPQDQLFGSGLRAAAAVSALDDQTTLHTYVSKELTNKPKVLAKTFGFSILPEDSSQVINFSYEHGLSEPSIYPNPIQISACEPLRLRGDRVLRFGFLEGTAIVEGNRVVYDPQTAENPESFQENGSQAEQLALVCNRREALAMSGETNLSSAASTLADQENATIIVVKDGAHGALLFDSEGTSKIPAYRTNKVWPLGSGDVFSAIFAHYWTTGMGAYEAANLASRATASYCERPTLPVSTDTGIFPSGVVEIQDDEEKRVQVYLAGPFFDSAQRWLLRNLKRGLTEQRIEVFSPYEDIGFGSGPEVAPKDLEAIEDSDAVLAVMNGTDFGTAFEIGYARALDIPVVCLAQNVQDLHMTMVEGSNCTITGDLPSAVYQASWEALTVGG